MQKYPIKIATLCDDKRSLDFFSRHYVLFFANSKATRKAFGQICNDTRIKYAEPDSYVTTSEITSDPKATYHSWGVNQIGANKYADYVKGKTDESLTVAVLDTGVGNHSFINNHVMKGLDFIDLDNNSIDLDGHGTHVTGTILDCTQGLNVNVLAVRVLGEHGGTGLTVGNGIRYAVDCGAKVINMSLGGGHTQYIDDAIDYAYKKGVVVVAAAGNDYGSADEHCPGHNSKAITVGAVDDKLVRAKFSNTGKALDVVAPGVNINSTLPGNRWANYQGTSMATPHISAAVAMIRLANPGKSNAEVESILYSSCTDLGSQGWDQEYGRGIPDLKKLIPGTPTPTPTPVPEKAKYYALLIAPKYGDEVIHQQDNKAMANMFARRGYAKVIGSSSLYAAQSAYSEATKDDVLVFYYSGRIAQVTENGTQKEILMILDNDKTYSFTELKNILDQYPGKKVILLDCPYAGAVVTKNGEKGIDNSILLQKIIRIFSNGAAKNGELLSSGYTIFAACGNKETDVVVSDGNGNKCSNFTKWICSGCGYDRINFQEYPEMNADSNKDNKITLSELKDYVIAIEKLNDLYYAEPVLYPANSQLVLVKK